MFPIFPFWFFGYAPGFIAGLFIGYLTKDMGKGILGGLISVFLGSMIGGGVVVRLWYGDVNFVNTGLTLGLGLGLVSFLPGVSCAALGALFSKEASRIHGFMVKHKRPTIVAVSVICLLLIASIASVTLIATFSYERCDGLVRLLEDQYSYVVTEKPMHLREELFYPSGAKLIDCGGDDEKFISELLDSGNATKVYYFKTPTAAYLWFRTSSWDRVVYVRYGLWQFEPIRSVDNSWIFELLLAYFVFPILILIFVAAMSSEPKRYEEPFAQAVLNSNLLKQYPEELLIKYQHQYPHNPTGVLEWHIHKKMKEGKTRDQALKELEESG
jgi:hypothetical protein